ncbi:MAG: GNAT family N-acetyltransferase [Clostridia bacterium]|jgi:RimJ/RimL family protein N-acetyltransferase|nr:GNAT family N-acetyltransferase [Clostridia bacterium]
MTIEITGRNLILRPMTQKEHRALWRKYSPDETDPRGRAAYEYDEEKTDALYAAIGEKADWCPVSGIFTKTDEIIGMVQIPRIVFSEKRGDVYVLLANESYRGKGFGTEALDLLAECAHRKLGLDRLYADIPATNLRMRRVLEKCGFMNSRVTNGYYRLADGDSAAKLDYVKRF